MKVRLRGAARQAGLVACAVALSIAHGAGLALVPLLGPLCAGGLPPPEALLPTLLPLALHVAVMYAGCAGVGRVLQLPARCFHRMSRKENTMADDKSRSQGQDRQRINVHQDYELRDWAKSLNTTPERLKEAVQAVGDRAEKVREYLSNDKPR